MKNMLLKEITFLLRWCISKSLTGIICNLFFEGALRNIVCFGEELIYAYTFLYFLSATSKHSLTITRPSERRFFQRYSEQREVSVTVLRSKVNLIADTVNRSHKGMMLVLDTHMRHYARKDVMLSIENELYRIVWGHRKGMQYQIGLQRQ